MSRKQLRDMRALARYIAGQPCLLRTDRDNELVWATYGGPTDEGYSYTRIMVCVNEGTPAGCYSVTFERNARDCDGRQHTASDSNWRRLARTRRIYWGGPSYRAKGQFTAKRWARIGDDHATQRDYSAEAMGY